MIRPVSRDLEELTERARAGGDRGRLGTKLPVRERLELLLDSGSFVEDGLLASALDEGLPADAVITGTGTVAGRPVGVVAHDPTVKAGSWGRRTVEKQIRLLERADRDLLPVFYLVDSAGGRLTDQLGFHAGHRGAARVFHLQVRLSGRVPQVCCLFGPSAAGGAYMPAFCDWVAMVDGNASMFLASPRIAAKAIGEVVSLEEMGGAAMHTSVSGLGDQLCADDAEAIAAARTFFSYLPSSWEERPAAAPPRPPAAADWDGVIPANPRAGYDVRAIMDHYAPTIEHSSPFIKRYNNSDDASIRGFEDVRDYFARALQRNPTLRFDPLHLTVGLESVILVYRRMTGDLAAELFAFDDAGNRTAWGFADVGRLGSEVALEGGPDFESAGVVDEVGDVLKQDEIEQVV